MNFSCTHVTHPFWTHTSWVQYGQRKRVSVVKYVLRTLVGMFRKLIQLIILTNGEIFGWVTKTREIFTIRGMTLKLYLIVTIKD